MYDPLQDGKSSLTLVDFMGGDLAIVNAARTSYDKQSHKLNDKDINLIQYLIDPPEGKQHTSPLRSTVFVFRVKAPLFVCRQWWKHHIASSHTDEQDQWNERSFRYSKITDFNDYYLPKQFRYQSGTNKQKGGEPLPSPENLTAQKYYVNAAEFSLDAYNHMVNDLGCAKEDARNILPAAMYTTFVWTVSLQAVLHFVDLREGAGAQWEITQYANVIKQVVNDECPNAVLFWENRKQREREALKLFKWMAENSLGTTANEMIELIARWRATQHEGCN